MKITSKTLSFINITLVIFFTITIWNDTKESTHFFGSLSFAEKGVTTQRLANLYFNHNSIKVKTNILKNDQLISTVNATFFLYQKNNNDAHILISEDSSYNTVTFAALDMYRIFSNCLILKPKGQTTIKNIRFSCR